MVAVSRFFSVSDYFFLICCSIFNVPSAIAVVAVHLLNCEQHFATPWTTVHQSAQSFTISQSLLKLMSIESLFILLRENKFLIRSSSQFCIRFARFKKKETGPSIGVPIYVQIHAHTSSLCSKMTYMLGTSRQISYNETAIFSSSCVRENYWDIYQIFFILCYSYFSSSCLILSSSHDIFLSPSYFNLKPFYSCQ